MRTKWDWHYWFAWHPVFLEDVCGYAWLCVVLRRWDEDGWAGARWHYRDKI